MGNIRLILVVAMVACVSLEAAETDPKKIKQQIQEQEALLSQYQARKEFSQRNKENYEKQLSQQQLERQKREHPALKESLLKMEEINRFLEAFDGDIQSAVNKIMHSELKQIRDETPNDKARTDKPFSSPSADLSNVQTGSEATGGGKEDNSANVMTGGDHAAIMREMSPAMKIEYTQQLKAKYEAALQKARDEYDGGLKKLHDTEEFKKLLQAEAETESSIAQCQTEIDLQKRNIQRQNLRLEGLEERLAQAQRLEKQKAAAPKDEEKAKEADAAPKKAGENKAAAKKTEDEPQNKVPVDVKDFPQLKVSVCGKWDDDYSQPKIKNIVTNTMTISFTNVGSQVQGCGAAVAKVSSVASLNGAQHDEVMTGTFSGGPNGVLRFQNDGEEVVMSVVGGKIVKTGMPGLGDLAISNPSAFSYWEK